MTYTIARIGVGEDTVTAVAQRFNAALDRKYASAHQQFRQLTPHELATLTATQANAIASGSSGLQTLMKAAPPIETAGVNITHYGKEWARISRDGTVTKLDIEMAREIRRGVTWDTGRVVSINDVLCMLVTDAYEMGRLAATPKRDTVRVRDL